MDVLLAVAELQDGDRKNLPIPKMAQSSEKEGEEILKTLPLFMACYPSPHTRENYERSVKEFLGFWSGRGYPVLYWEQMRRTHIDAFMRHLETHAKNSRSTVATKIATLVSFCRFAYEQGFTQSNVGENIRLPRISKAKGKTEALSEVELGVILTHLQQGMESADKASFIKEDYTAYLQYGIFITLATMGMRVSELIALKKRDLVSCGDYYKLQLKLKGNVEHSPLIPKFLSDFLLNFIKACKPFLKEEDFIFTTFPLNNKPMDREYITEIIAKVAKRCGIEKKISAHSLRATVASMLHKNGVPVGEIKDLLGHQNIMTTMMYIRKTDEEQESAALKNPIHKMIHKKETL